MCNLSSFIVIITMNAEIYAVYKLVIVGNSGVGKTSLLTRYFDDCFSDTHEYTIGVDFRVKTLNIEGNTIKVQIWDTAGQERFKTIISSYYRSANGIPLIFDITDEKSLEDIDHWMEEINKNASSDTCKILIGNKSDLAQKRKVSFEQANEVARKYGMKYVETSAKTGENVLDGFLSLCTEILHKPMNPKKEDVKMEKKEVHSLSPFSKTVKYCCN